MRSLAVCIFVVTLVGGGLCGRLRRQAPPPGAIPEGVIPEGVDIGPAEGAEATATTPSKVDGLNTALGFMIADVQNKAALGEPVDPKKLDKLLKLTLVIGLLGGEVSEPNQDGIESLMAAAAPPAPEA